MNTQTYDGPAPSELEQADDEIYANAVNALAAVFRMDIEESQRKNGTPGAQFASVLVGVARQVREGWAGTDALYLRDVFDQFGPGAVLLALKRAYEIPQPSAPLVGD